MEPVTEPEIVPTPAEAEHNLQETTDEMVVDAHTEVPAAEHHDTEPFWQDPTFWVAMSFFIFIAIAAKYIWPLIGRGLDSRAEKIAEQLEAAAKLRREAEELLKHYEKQQKQALKEAEEILENAKRDAKSIRENAAKDLKASLERRTQQAEDNIAREEQKAVQQLRAQLIDTATEVVKTQLAGQKDDAAITRALGAIERQIA